MTGLQAVNAILKLTGTGAMIGIRQQANHQSVPDYQRSIRSEYRIRYPTHSTSIQSRSVFKRRTHETGMIVNLILHSVATQLDVGAL